MGERRLFSRKELPFLAGILAIIIGLFLLRHFSPQGSRAVVEVNGVAREVRELSALAGPETLAFQGENGISLTVEFTPRGARILESNCPDKNCVRTGSVARVGEAAICLPGRVVLKIDGAGAVDAVTY